MSLPPRVNYMQKKPATLTLHTSIPAERCIRLQPRTPQASLEPRFSGPASCKRSIFSCAAGAQRRELHENTLACITADMSF